FSTHPRTHPISPLFPYTTLFRSLMADDEPYEVLADGKPTGLVEIPVEWIRDDAPYFSFDRYSAVRPHTPPRGVLTIWQDEFDHADRKSTRLNSSHVAISYAVFCL